MTVQLGDTGRVAYGTLKTFNITLATPRETLLGTPVALPTTEPAGGASGAQVSFTVLTADLPTISPNPISTKYCATLVVGGKNTDAASQSVSYHVYKNGTSLASAGSQASIATNTFWTQGHSEYFDIAVGDVFAVSTWSSSANVNYDYYALIIYPTRMNLGKAYINKDVSYTNIIAPTLVSGTAAVNITNGGYVFPISANNSLNVQLTASTTFTALGWNSTYYAWKNDKGDNNTFTNPLTHATSRPYYQRSYVPGTISFREILR